MKNMTFNLSLAAAKDRTSQDILWRFPARLSLCLLVSGLFLQMPAVWAQQQETPEKTIVTQKSPFGTYGSFEKLLRAAEEGNADAQVQVSICYGKGNGVTQDYGKAFTWAMKSAEQGNAKGASIVASCYLQGKGIRKDMPLAVEWLQKAASQGNAEAQNNLGVIYYYGVEGVPKDEKKAFPLFEKSANQDDPDAQYHLGLMYYLGAEGVPQDEKKAFFWFEKSAKQNHPDAQYYMAACYSLGKGVKKDISQEFYWLEKSAEQGHPDAQYNLACLYFNDKDVQEILNQSSKLIFEKTKDQSQEIAQKKYSQIEPEVQSKIEKMVYWFNKAAEQGVAHAQRNMGIFYAMGLGGLKKDVNKALELWKKAAEAGDSEAQYALGSCYAGDVEYYDPDKIYQNMPEAKKWLQKAADQGNEKAKEALERLFHIKASS